jgi:hypothetical protein
MDKKMRQCIKWIMFVNASLINSEGKGKVVPVLFLTEHNAMKAYWGSGSIAPLLFDLGTRWR